MPRNIVAVIWLAGIAVAVLAYAADPAALLDTLGDWVARAFAAADQIVRSLATLGSGVVRALAVGLFATFVALALLAIHHGHRAWTALLAVSAVFVLLVHGGAGNERWVAAFALAAVAALVMTRRLRGGTA